MTKEYMFLVYRWVKSFQNSGSIFNQKIQEENYQFIKAKEYDIKSLFGDKNNDLLDIDEVPKIYEINKEAFKNFQSYVKIYSK